MGLATKAGVLGFQGPLKRYGTGAEDIVKDSIFIVKLYALGCHMADREIGEGGYIRGGF